MTHLLMLLDKMCKYEMVPRRIIEDTERTRFCPQTDKKKPVYPLFNFVEAGGIKIYHIYNISTMSETEHGSRSPFSCNTMAANGLAM